MSYVIYLPVLFLYTPPHACKHGPNSTISPEETLVMSKLRPLTAYGKVRGADYDTQCYAHYDTGASEAELLPCQYGWEYDTDGLFTSAVTDVRLFTILCVTCSKTLYLCRWTGYVMRHGKVPSHKQSSVSVQPLALWPLATSATPMGAFPLSLEATFSSALLELHFLTAMTFSPSRRPGSLWDLLTFPTSTPFTS